MANKKLKRQLAWWLKAFDSQFREPNSDPRTHISQQVILDMSITLFLGDCSQEDRWDVLAFRLAKKMQVPGLKRDPDSKTQVKTEKRYLIPSSGAFACTQVHISTHTHK